MARLWAAAALLVVSATGTACLRLDTGAVENVQRRTVTTRCPVGDPQKLRCTETTTETKASVDKRGWGRVSPAAGNDPDTDTIIVELIQD